MEPFLRGFGFAITLEPLTQAERNLLYEIRDFYKFRQDFFVFIGAGQAAFIPGVQPGVIALSPGTVATPLAGQVISQPLPVFLPTAVGAPLVTTQLGPGSATLLGPIQPPGATTQGFLSTIGEKANLVVTYQNIDAVSRFLDTFRIYLDGGIVGKAQVNQVEQQLLSSRETALNSQVTYRISLDQFKFQLGIPQCIDIDLADEQLEAMFKLIRQLDHLSKDQQNLTNDSAALSGMTDTRQIRQQYRNLIETAPLTKGTKASREILRRWAAWEKLSDKLPPMSPKLEQIQKERDQLLDKKAASPQRTLSPADQRRLDELEDVLVSPLDRRINQLRREVRRLEDRKATDPEDKLSPADQKLLDETKYDLQLGRFERFIRQLEDRSWERLGTLERETDEQMRARLEMLQNERKRLQAKEKLTEAEQKKLAEVELEIGRVLRWLELRAYQQAGIRSGVHRGFLDLVELAVDERHQEVEDSWPCLPLVCAGGVDLLSAPEDIVLTAMQKVALERRLDLMNYRGQVVDAWREITVAANGLLGVLNLQYHGDFGSPSPGYHPLAVGGSNYHQQLIINWSAPFVRIVERNLYRAALINFQAVRRRLMAAEDDVLFGVRIDMRNVRAFAWNFHWIQKRAIVLAYQQVDVALQAFSQPQIPTGPSAPPGTVGQPSAVTNIGDPAALTNQLLTAQSRLLGAQTDLYNTWIGFQVNRMDLYRDMGLMPLDKRGVWLDEESTCDCGPRLPHPGPSLNESEKGGTKQPSTEQLPEPRKLPEQLPEPRKFPGAGQSREPARLPTNLPAPGPGLE